jgi:hypothetical protein
MSFKGIKLKRKSVWSAAYILLLTLMPPSPAGASAAEDLNANPGNCYGEPSHIAQQYMLRTVFDPEFSKKLVSVKIKPLAGKVVEGYVPLRNWTTTLTDEYILFEKKSEGMSNPLVGLIVGIEYGEVVDHIDVEMTQTTDSGKVYVWDNNPRDGLPYVQVPRLNIPVVEGVDDLTKVPLDDSYKICYNEDYVKQAESRLLMVVTSVSILLFIVVVGFAFMRRMRVR